MGKTNLKGMFNSFIVIALVYFIFGSILGSKIFAYSEGRTRCPDPLKKMVNQVAETNHDFLVQLTKWSWPPNGSTFYDHTTFPEYKAKLGGWIQDAGKNLKADKFKKRFDRVKAKEILLHFLSNHKKVQNTGYSLESIFEELLDTFPTFPIDAAVIDEAKKVKDKKLHKFLKIRLK